MIPLWRGESKDFKSCVNGAKRQLGCSSKESGKQRLLKS